MLFPGQSIKIEGDQRDEVTVMTQKGPMYEQFTNYIKPLPIQGKLSRTSNFPNSTTEILGFTDE